MSFQRLTQRSWYYYRVGQSGYLSLVVGLVQFLFVATLYLQRIPQFANLHFLELAVIFLVPYTIGAIGTGYIHTKKQMNTDNMLATVQNPFLYVLTPGKESRVSYPIMLLNLEVSRRFCEVENLMDADLELQFKQMEQLLRKLLAGESVR